MDPDFQRTYNWETTAGIQHELFPRVSVSATWYRRAFSDLRVTDNLLRTMDDYRPISVVSPLDGEVFNIYTVNPAVQALVDNFDTNATDGFEQTYNGFDIDLQRAAAARRLDVRRLHHRAHHARRLRRAGRSQHAPILR